MSDKIQELERRDIVQQDADVRADSENGKPVIKGYAAVFNSLSEDLGGFRERILPTAFDLVLRKNQDVRALYNHDANFLLGRSSSGTLRLWADEKGLGYTVTLPDSRADVLEAIKRKDVTGSSFAFRLAKDGDEWMEEDGKLVREIRSFAELLDVGPVVYPAYRDTKVSTRSLEQFQQSKDETQERQEEQAKEAYFPSNDDRLRKLRLMEGA